MYYVDLRANLIFLLERFGVCDYNALLNFFRSHKREHIDYQINSLVHDSYAKIVPVFDPATNEKQSYANGEPKLIIQWTKCSDIQPEYIEDNTAALRIMASEAFGENAIADFTRLASPMTAVWLTHDNMVYDLIVFNESNIDGRSLYFPYARAQFQTAGVPDDVVHLAAVSDPELLSRLQPYSFDCFYYLPPEGEPILYQYTED